MIRLADDAAWFADRPGNRRADSFRNILTQPRIAAHVALVSGSAQITTDETMRASFAVGGKTPTLVTCVAHPDTVLHDSPALARARLWPATPAAHTIDPAAIIVGHVKLSKERGLHAALLRTAVSMPGLMRKGLERDYKANLY